MRWMLASVMVSVLGCGAEGTSGIDTAEVGDTSLELGETLDPCAGITCDTPPDDCHAATGTCQNGVCSYAARDGETCDDGDPCTSDDRCNDGCGGRQVACAAPPPDACEDGTTLVVHAATGTCGDGGCSYESQRVACASGCVDGACAGDACAGVVCDAPPSGCHQATGRCVSGVCRYDFDDGAGCDDGDTCSTNDQCEAGVCVGGGRLTCTTPPPATCSGNTLSVPAADGACAAGQCSYASTTVTCELGCAANGTACVGDPCEGGVCDGCAGQRVTWGTAGCRADLVAADHGAVVSLTSDAADTTGAATATCDDATWVVTGTTCTEATNAGWKSVAVGATFSYGVRADGSLWGWGHLHLPITGVEQEEHRPVRIGNLDGWEHVATYRDRVCGIMDGFLYCWGWFPVGDATGEYRRDPVRLRNDETWLTVAVGLRHTCAIDTSHRLFCWGDNGDGQLGISPIGAGQIVPRQVSLLLANRPNDDWQSLALGEEHTCGVTSDAVWCWGASGSGQYINVGFDVNPNYQQTMPVTSLLAAGRHHTCTLDTATQRVRCYGYNSLGQGGSSPDGNGADTLVGWTQIDAARDSTCGVLAGKLYCFGALVGGPEAQQMGTRSNWRVVDLGYGAHQCALDTTGELYCWGANDVGQLGDGTTTAREASDMVLVTP